MLQVIFVFPTQSYVIGACVADDLFQSSPLKSSPVQSSPVQRLLTALYKIHEPKKTLAINTLTFLFFS